MVELVVESVTPPPKRVAAIDRNAACVRRAGGGLGLRVCHWCGHERGEHSRRPTCPKGDGSNREFELIILGPHPDC